MEVNIEKLSFRERSRPQWKYTGHGPGYFSPTRREFNKNSRLYVSKQDEGVMDNFLYGRFTNPSREIGKALREILPDFIKVNQLVALNRDAEVIETLKIHWSQYAGCSCPCSPGFVVAARLETSDWKPVDLWATYSMILSKREQKEYEAHASQVADDRAASLVI